MPLYSFTLIWKLPEESWIFFRLKKLVYVFLLLNIFSFFFKSADIDSIPRKISIPLEFLVSSVRDKQ